MDENVKLRTKLGRYLDGVTLSEKAKAKYNALMVHYLSLPLILLFSYYNRKPYNLLLNVLQVKM